MTNTLISIFSLTRPRYAEAVKTRLGKGYFHAEKIYSELFSSGSPEKVSSKVEPQAFSIVSDILAITRFVTPEISRVEEEGEVKKFCLRYEDGLESESVILPMKFGYTLCVSSQIGCRMGCAFCRTGTMGLVRSLTVEEIVLQWFAARFVFGVPIRNIVFMGMGEPFDNYEAVLAAIEVMTCPGGIGLGKRSITVSTSGKVEEIIRFANEPGPGACLAVSLNAPDDGVRSKLMPVNKVHDLAALKEALVYYSGKTGRKIFIEYVLIRGRNDSEEAAEAVASYLRGLNVSINLIAYNDKGRSLFSSPSQEEMNRFRNRLRNLGYNVLLRGVRGRSVMAACGQLGNKGKTENCLRKEVENV